MSEADKSQIISTAQGYLSQMDGALSSVRGGLEGLQTAKARADQALVGANSGATQAEAALEAAQVNADAQIEQAKAALEAAQANANAQIAQLEAALKNAERIAENQVIQAENQLRLAASSNQELVVRAPVSGEIQEVYVRGGEFVAVGTPVVKVVDTNSPPRLRLSLSTEEAELIRLAGEVSLYDQQGNKTALAVTRVNSTPDPRTQKIRAEFTLPKNMTRMPIGSLVRVDIPLTGVNSAIPLTAISFEPSGPEVLVVNDSGVTERRQVVLGNPLGSGVEVRSGLEGGEMVVEKREGVGSGEAVQPAS